jgi:hypothetical protein
VEGDAARAERAVDALRTPAPAARKVPVQRVVEKVVVRPLAYDRAKIDAALRSHGQQPPR